MMQGNDFHKDPSSNEAASTENGHIDTSVNSTQPFEPPRIPVGLPHVVQFVEGSLYHLPQTIQNVGQKMSRYADKDGVVSIALPFLCDITGLGSHHTADHAIQVMESLGVLVKHPSKGGRDRRSNRYTFLGSDRTWRPLPAEPRGTDPWVALSKSRRENEVLRAELEELKARMALMTNGHSEVTDGDGPEASDSYESANPLDEGATISHSGVTDGQGDSAPETASHSYENEDPDNFTGEYGAISHSGVTDGSGEGPEYLARRARVEKLVLEHRDYYTRSFNRGGLPSAVEYFSRSAGHERELMDQVALLDAGADPLPTGGGASQEAGDLPQSPADSDRYEVGRCPDCGRPFATHGGATHCTDCTERRRRESEA